MTVLWRNLAIAGALEASYRNGWQAAVYDCDYGQHNRPPWEPEPEPAHEPEPVFYGPRTRMADTMHNLECDVMESIWRNINVDQSCPSGTAYVVSGLEEFMKDGTVRWEKL